MSLIVDTFEIQTFYDHFNITKIKPHVIMKRLSEIHSIIRNRDEWLGVILKDTDFYRYSEYSVTRATQPHYNVGVHIFIQQADFVTYKEKVLKNRLGDHLQLTFVPYFSIDLTCIGID